MDNRALPDETRRIELLKSAWKCERLILKRALAGNSGAQLHLVDAQFDGFDGQAILKVSLNDLAHEGHSQAQALELSPEFGSSHFPRVVRYEKFEGWSALLMTVAGSGLLFTNVFSSISKSSFRLLAAQSITDQVLSNWNIAASFSKEEYTASSLLEDWLGRRVGPSSRLPNLIEKLYDVSAESEGFEISGNRYPNPFAFVSSDAARSSNAKLFPICGFSHGDLHGANVLVREYPATPSEFFIIDFDSFEEAKPLLFDNAYFELSYLLKQREGAVLDRWLSLLESLENVEETSVVASGLKDSEDQGHVWCAASMRSIVRSWVSRKFPERREDLTKQMLLARIAAGLNFAQKTQLDSAPQKSNKLKEFSLLYAASNLRNFLRFTRLEDRVTYVPVHRDSCNQKSNSTAWRNIWEACDSFNEERNTYVLLGGPRLGDEFEYSRYALAQISWSVVLDFDNESDKGRLLATVRGPISQRRGFHLAIAGQTPAVTFSKAVCWLMADGWNERPDSIKRHLPEWRRNVVPAVRDIAQRLKLETAPKPIKIVILGEGIEAPKVRAICTALEETLPGAHLVVVTNGEADATYDYISEEVSQIRRFKCSYSDLTAGIHRMFGEAPEGGEAYIPIRDPKGGISRLKIEQARLALFNETFELVYDGAAREEPRTDEVNDFFKGNTITWRELDIGLDVPRAVSSSLQEQLIQRIGKSRAAAIALEHTPGAGGTTVARRIAWSLRNTYPTLILNRYIETTPELIDSLAHASNLPVVIIIERRDLSDAERDHLFRKLKGRNIRFIFLDVRRALKPREDGVSTFALTDPMSASEANKFFERYSSLVVSTRQKKALKLLTVDRVHLDFRSAFFYGFYAFEDEFLRVPEFVSAHLNALTLSQRIIVARLALISRYSQSRLPSVCLSMLADIAIPETSDLTELLGSSRRLIVFDTASLGIVHPAIAEEVLAQSLKGTREEIGWRAHLADFCVNFIVAIGKSPEAYGDNINDILAQLFVERSIWENPNQPRLFSNLIETIPTKEGQRRVLEILCNTFPSNAHFWNHLGRHLNLRIRAPYVESERCFLRAIELEPQNEIHHHALGMVYRLEVRGQLERPLDRSQQLSERLSALEVLFGQAEQCFRDAHQLDPENEYPLVTHIQLIIESIERVFSLSGEKTYQDLLKRSDGVGSWCRLKLQRAETLLADLKSIQAESEHSKYTIEFESRLFGLYGNFEAMVRGLTELLSRGDANKRATRRLIAYCHLRQNKEDLDRIDKGTARRVAGMMLENLADDPSSGSDIRLWLRAFRILPEFTLTEALERVGTWAVLSENIDAYYYLYILHYVHLARGAHSSLIEVQKYIEICRRKAPPLLSKRSFEWWASPNLSRPFPLVHHGELSGWNRNSDFWTNSEKLGFVEGVVDEIRTPQAGSILTNGLPVFFVPARLLSSADVNTKVRFHLGFSYEGLRAWNVQRA